MCANYRFSQEQVGGYWQQSTSWAGPRSDMLSGMITASECYEQGLTMDSSTTPPYSAISEHSSMKDTPQHIREWLTSLPAASPASPSVLPESKPEQTTRETCGLPPSDAFAWYDPATASLRTFQASLIADISPPSSVTLPKAGLMSGGVCYRRLSWERRIGEIGSGWWQSAIPTPTKEDAGRSGSREGWEKYKSGWQTSQWRLRNWAHAFPTPADPTTGGGARRGLWPTPTQRDWRSGKASEKTHARNSRPLSEQIGHQENGGQLNPDWVAWLMGWPIGWEDLKPLGMDRFQPWLRQHGIC